MVYLRIKRYATVSEIQMASTSTRFPLSLKFLTYELYMRFYCPNKIFLCYIKSRYMNPKLYYLQ